MYQRYVLEVQSNLYLADTSKGWEGVRRGLGNTGLTASLKDTCFHQPFRSQSQLCRHVVQLSLLGLSTELML